MKLKTHSLEAKVQADPKSRRMFLKSAGGLMLSIPLMPSLLTSFSEKALADASVPRRYVSLFSAFGGLQERNWGGLNLPQNPFALYSGQTARKDLISNLTQANALSPVLSAAYQNLWPSTNLIMGVDQPYYVGHNRGVPLGAFTASLSGQPTVTDQGDFGKPGFMDREYPSIDQVLGYANGNGVYGLGLGGRRRFLNVATVWASSSWGRDDYVTNDHVTARDFINTTSGIFSYLFGGVYNGTGTNPLLNLVNEFWPSGKTLMARLSGDDRDSLDQLFTLASQAANDYSLPGPNTTGVTAPASLATNVPMVPADLQTLADLIAMAFKCDVTRIVNIHCETVVNGYDFHAVSHMASNADPNAGQSQMVEIYKNQSENLFARLGNNLLAADPFDPSNSILKNSLMLWTHENKCAHHLFSLPTLMIGEAGGRIQTGTFADLRDLTQTREVDGVGDQLYVGEIANRLWANVFYAMNIPRSSYEVSRGGTADTVALSKGYGHVIKLSSPSFYNIPNYNLSQIGEPWSFLQKSGVAWG